MVNQFEIGKRIVIKGHWEFPNGITGTIVEPTPFQLSLASPGEWKGHIRKVKGRKNYFYFIL